MRKVSGSNPAFTQPLCFIIANYLLVNGDGNGFSRRWFRLYLSFPLLLVYRLGWPFAIIKLVSNFWLCPGRTPNRYFWFCIWHFFCYGTTCYKVFNTKTLRVLRWQKRTDWMMRKCSAGLLDGYEWYRIWTLLMSEWWMKSLYSKWIKNYVNRHIVDQIGSTKSIMLDLTWCWFGSGTVGHNNNCKINGHLINRDYVIN